MAESPDLSILQEVAARVDAWGSPALAAWHGCATPCTAEQALTLCRQTAPAHARDAGNPYVGWLARHLAHTPFTADDLTALRLQLVVLDRYGAELPPHERDLSPFSHDGAWLEATATRLLRRSAGRVADCIPRHGAIAGSTTVAHEGPEGLIVIPHTVRALQFWDTDPFRGEALIASDRRTCHGKEVFEATFQDMNRGGHPPLLMLPTDGGCWLKTDGDLFRDQRAGAPVRGPLPHALARLWMAGQTASPLLADYAARAAQPRAPLQPAALALPDWLSPSQADMLRHDLPRRNYSRLRNWAGDPAVLSLAIRIDGRAASVVPPYKLADKSFLMTYVTLNGDAWFAAPEPLRRDPEVLLQAGLTTPSIIPLLDPELATPVLQHKILQRMHPDRRRLVAHNFPLAWGDTALLRDPSPLLGPARTDPAKTAEPARGVCPRPELL